MATAEEEFTLSYKYIFEDLLNPVTKKWFLVENPILFLTLIVTYLLYCTKIGPWHMKNKRPYDLQNVIKIYNLVQVLISLYIVQQILHRIIFYDFDFKCQSIGSDNRYFPWEAKISYVYFTAKITELLDTIFFVLRKSDRQITFLHLFHHTLMPTACWIGMMYFPGGNSAIMGLCNSLVHVVMYSYYLIASYGEKYKKILWWKKYVTVMQLVQFVVVGLHSFHSLFYNYCGYPVILKVITVIQAIFFYKMFWDFYSKTYLRSNTETSKKTTNGVHKNGKHKSY